MPSDLGVYHFDVSGRIPFGVNHTEAVHLQAFLKGVVVNDVVQLRGLAFVHSLDAEYLSWSGGDRAASPAVLQWKPKYRLYDVSRNNSYEFVAVPSDKHLGRDHEGHPILLMPLIFNLSIPKEVLNTPVQAFRLYVDDWDHFWTLTSDELLLQGDLLEVGTLTAVFPPLNGDLSSRAAVEIIMLNVLYHSHLGLSIIAYISAAHASYLKTHPCFPKLNEQNGVTFVMWNVMPNSISKPAAYNRYVWSHAALATWHSGSHLLMIDSDEFLVFSPKWSVKDFLNHCIGTSPHVTLPRFDTVCSTCADAHSDSVDFGWTGHGELNESAECNMQTLRAYGRIANGHPVGSGKTVVDPSLVHGFSIHYGHRLAGNHENSDRNCASVLHLVNFWAVRARPSSMQIDADWAALVSA